MKIEVCYIRCFIENLRRQHEELAHPFSTHRFITNFKDRTISKWNLSNFV